MIKQSLYKQIKSFFLRNKVSDFEYDCVRTEVYQTNKNILCVCSSCAAILFGLLTILSIIFGENFFFRHFIAYAATFLALGITFLLSFNLKDHNIKYSTPLVYVFILIVTTFTIYSDIFVQKADPAVFYIVFEFAFPLIFVAKIKRLYVFSFCMNSIFCTLSFLFKTRELALNDIFDCWIFYFLSMLPSFYLTKIRIREFSLRQIIENERDTDSLTGLLNKAAFTRDAKKSINATKSGILIIMDLDFFKEVNDSYGHIVGDNVLRVTGMCVSSTFRSTDIVGRFGGDEFVILMANTNNTEIAQQKCDDLIKKLNTTRIMPTSETDKTTIHASIGFCQFTDENDFDELFKKSDSALYVAKNSGKDRACAYKV